MSYNKVRTSLAAAVGLAATMLLWGCQQSTTQPHANPVFYGVDISPLNNLPQTNVNSNFDIAGKVLDNGGNKLQGIQVFFSFSPADMGSCTPYATTDTASSNGFDSQVVFLATKTGVVVITGAVKSGNTVTSQDTLSVLVSGAVNG